MSADITIVGNLGADPELKFTQSGKAVANFTVIDNTSRKDASGQWQQVGSQGWRCTAWERDAEAATEHLRKGDRVIAVGTPQYRAFEHNGQQRTSIELAIKHIARCLPKAAGQSQQGHQAAQQAAAQWGTTPNEEPPF